MNKLYEILEVCLNEIEQGADLDTVLFRYPELADELRPVLESSVKAREMAVPVPSQEVVRRNRAKLLQHAAEMREAKASPISHRVWSVPLRRALVTLLIVATLFGSGTGLVRASSNTLPGDNLYPVKRTWEDVSLFFTFNTNKRQELELEQENERLDELHLLFAEGRSAPVDFAGYVTSQTGTEWRVSGVTVFISADTQLPKQQVLVGDGVRVHGRAQNDGVAATQIILLPKGSQLPEVEGNESEIEMDGVEGTQPAEQTQPQIEDDSESKSATEDSIAKVPVTPTNEFYPNDESVEGRVTSIENNLIVVNGIVMDIRFTNLKNPPAIGMIAKVEGYYDNSGVFIVTKIEFESSGTTILSSTEDNANDNNTSSTNEDNHNDNEHENENNTNSTDH